MALALAAGGAAQQPGFEVLLRDGTAVRATGVTGDADAGFELQVDGKARRVAGGEVLALCGAAVAAPTLPVAQFAGGDQVVGALVGGDAGGNRFEILSPVFGRVGFAVDRLEVLAAPGVDALRAWQLPAGVNEALFVRAAVGFDVIAGALHQIGEAGVRFQGNGSESPRWFRLDEIAVLRLREAVARDDAPTATLLSRVGDRVGVRGVRFSGDGLACELEGGGKVSVRASDVASVVFRREVVLLSDLAPQQVVESGFDGEVVRPFRVDRNVLGGALVSGGRSAAKGLGVHARSKLVFRVPDGIAGFCARVGYDDSASALGLAPRADVAVLVGGKVAFERKDLAAGQPPVATGLIAVHPGDTVALVVEPGAGRDLGDRINWLLPVFLPGKRP